MAHHMTSASVATAVNRQTATDPVAELRCAEARLYASCGVVVHEKFLSLARPRTRVRILESGSGSPALHVHGGGAFAAISVPLAAALPGRRHIMLDRPGFGLSDHVDMTSNVRQQSVDLLASTLDALDLQEVDIVANSLGGAMAIWFALAHPDRVRSLALVGAAAFIGEVGVPLPFRLLGTRGLGAFLLSLEPPSPKQVRSLWKRFGHDPSQVDPAMLDVTLRAEQIPGYARAWREILHATVGPFGPRPGLDIPNQDIVKLACPVAFAWGDADPTVGVRVGRAVSERLPCSRFTSIPGAGHLPWITDAIATAAAIEPVLAPRAESDL
jgi:pimeloyl-ACP methyl ester carboxylesterase